MNDWIALAVTFVLALMWLRLNDYFAQRGWVSSSVSRKIIHMGTGPIFVICWLLFSSNSIARYLAALVPLAITLQFFLVGTGLWKDPDAVKAMSRSGDKKEILRGPLFYGIAFVVLTLVYWKDSPIGIVALMLLCGGDGLADIIGKRFRSGPLPWSQKKSWYGSLAMFCGGWLFAVLVLLVYQFNGALSISVVHLLPAITLIAIAGTLVESLPIQDFDNVTVPLVAVILGNFFLH
jgi:phytol kinase